LKLLNIIFAVLGLVIIGWVGYLTYLNLFVPEYMDGYQGTHRAEVMIINKGYDETNKDYWLRGIESHKLTIDDEATYFIVKEKDDWKRIESNRTYLLDYYIVEKVKRNNKLIPIVRGFREKLD
jgi:hypothetical protein